MMSLAYIEEINREQAEIAAEEGLNPFVYATTDEVNRAPFPFPHIGDHRPEGWELVDQHFVDSSGFGSPGEPALTQERFREIVNERRFEHAAEGRTVGWALIEAGQFQVYVGEFVRNNAQEEVA